VNISVGEATIGIRIAAAK